MEAGYPEGSAMAATMAGKAAPPPRCPAEGCHSYMIIARNKAKVERLRRRGKSAPKKGEGKRAKR